MQKKKILMAVIGIIIMIMAGITLTIWIRSDKMVKGLYGKETDQYNTYEKHYAFITKNYEDSFLEEIWEGCRKKGAEQGVYVEWLGRNMDADYAIDGLLEMAIAAKVDGIIIEADEDEEIETLIRKASEESIPVVTVMSDCYGSLRKSFIGVGNYNLGKKYGEQIVQTATPELKKILILMDTETDEKNQSILCNGIRDTINNAWGEVKTDFETVAIDSHSTLSSDEDVRNLLVNMEELPEVIVCLNEKTTMSVYQAAIDYNIVGKVSILGYYDSESILRGVDKEILSSTITVDFEKMGELCVAAILEYKETGYVSDCFLLEAEIVNHTNVKEYLENASAY